MILLQQQDGTGVPEAAERHCLFTEELPNIFMLWKHTSPWPDNASDQAVQNKAINILRVQEKPRGMDQMKQYLLLVTTLQE